jgi:hypothetical protein
VLTFDDGPWPKNTQAVLAALAAHCSRAIFFPIGLHATYEPGILKQVAAAGHAIGSHTWCHQDLSKTKGRCNVNGKTVAVEYDPKDEIEKGLPRCRSSCRTVGSRTWSPPARPRTSISASPSSIPGRGGQGARAGSDRSSQHPGENERIADGRDDALPHL